MEKFNPFFETTSRIFLALIFLLSGLGKAAAYDATQSYMSAMGVPAFMLTPTIVFEVVAALCIIVGYKTRVVALLLAGFCLVTAVLFHNALSDQIQFIMFLKNVGMAGGFLALARYGAGTLSLDGKQAPIAETLS